MLLRLLGDQAGVSLVEIVVSLALLGLVGVGLTLGLFTANLAVAQVRERNQAVHLAESQMEIIKASSFISTTVGVVVTGTYPIPAEVPGYTVTNTVTTLTTTLDTPYQIVTATQTGFELSGLKTRVTP